MDREANRRSGITYMFFVAICLLLSHLTSGKGMWWHSLWQEARQIHTYFRAEPFREMDILLSPSLQQTDAGNHWWGTCLHITHGCNPGAAICRWEGLGVWLRNVYAKQQHEAAVQIQQGKELELCCICLLGTVTWALVVLPLPELIHSVPHAV